MTTAEMATAPVKATLISSHKAVKAGGAIRLGLRLELEEGWSVSWTNPGRAGEPVVVKPNLPDAFAAQHVRWPAPSIDFVKGTGKCYGYEKEVVAIMTVKVGKDAKAGKHKLVVDASWVGRKGAETKKGKAAVTVEVEIAGADVVDDAAKKLLGRWFRKVPTSSGADTKVEMVKSEDDKNHWRVSITAGKDRKITTAQFVPSAQAKRLRGVLERSKEGADTLAIDVPVMGVKSPENAKLRGVITIRGTMKDGEKTRRFEQSWTVRPAPKKK